MQLCQNIPPVIEEVGPPLTADECGFVLEELAVCATAFLQDGTFPFPKRPFPSAVGQTGVLAVFVRDFFGRPSGNAHA